MHPFDFFLQRDRQTDNIHTFRQTFMRTDRYTYIITSTDRQTDRQTNYFKSIIPPNKKHSDNTDTSTTVTFDMEL